ncbi:MAG TPA: DNA polymerase III subunit beta [Aestuariivirgaceae bacterium]|jgi:DNA polymerase-3 subunit beta
MRVTIERSAFLRSLNHVQSVVERRNTIPILSNVLIHAADGAVRLTATDLDIEVVETVAAELSREGAATAPAHVLYDIVRKLPEGSQLAIEHGPDEGRVSVLSGRSRFSLAALPPQDFPDLAAGELSHKFTMPAADLKTLIEKTRFAISTEETRYYLNGIYLHDVAVGGTAHIRAVATDGHRLAQVQFPCPEGAKGMPGIIVPRKTVLELSKLIESAEGDVDVALSSSKIRFAIDGLTVTSKLIDGTFPDYERVIPRHNDKTLQVDTKLFVQAVDRVSTVSSEKGRAVKLHVSADRILLTVNNPDAGSAEDELSASYSAAPLDIGFNSRYLLDIVGQFKGDTANFDFADAGSPTIIRDPADGSALYVLMPMRV